MAAAGRFNITQPAQVKCGCQGLAAAEAQSWQPSQSGGDNGVGACHLLHVSDDLVYQGRLAAAGHALDDDGTPSKRRPEDDALQVHTG